MRPEERIIYADMNMPLRVQYGSKKVFGTFDTIEIRTIMEKMGEGKKHFRLPDGYYIEFVNTDRHSERPVVGKICREPTEQKEESQEERIPVYSTPEGKLYIKPSELFALKRVQDLILKISEKRFNP